jgi:hypothetical protein
LGDLTVPGLGQVSLNTMCWISILHNYGEMRLLLNHTN